MLCSRILARLEIEPEWALEGLCAQQTMHGASGGSEFPVVRITGLYYRCLVSYPVFLHINSKKSK